MDEKNSTLNIHQKLLKLVVMAGALKKNKQGFNYKYTTEDEVQAKVTAGMKQYGLMLYPRVVPGTFQMTPISYTKWDKKIENADGTKGREVPVNEVIVSAEMTYEWVNADNPSETVTVPWALIGQMEDAAQAFGAGLTYTNRYFLLKSLQIATTESDPDNYRSKQKSAENFEEEEALKAAKEALATAIKEITDAGTALLSTGYSRDDMYSVIGKYNNGETDKRKIATLEIAAAIKKEFDQMLANKSGEKKSTKKTTKKTTEEEN